MKNSNLVLASALAGVVVGLGLTNNALGANRGWVNSSGGDFSSTANWGASATATTGGSTVPGSADQAYFQIAAGGTYQVNFTGDVTNARLTTVDKSNHVTFDLGGFTHLVSGASANQYLDVAATAGASSLTITDGKLQLAANNPIRIGLVEGANGSMTVNNGGILDTAGLVTVGNANNAIANLTIGATGLYTGSNSLQVGQGSVGTVLVQGGGDVTLSNIATIGANAGGDGTLTVTGEGSTFTITGGTSVSLGRNNAGAKGTINVLNQGKITSSRAINLGTASSGNPGGTGYMVVDGANSEFTSSFAGNAIQVGATLLTETPSSIVVTNGGLVRASDSIGTVFIGTIVDSAGGTVSVTGANSRLVAGGGMILGATSGAGTAILTVGTGSKVQLGGTSTIRQTGTLDLTGGTVEFTTNDVNLGSLGLVTGAGTIIGTGAGTSGNVLVNGSRSATTDRNLDIAGIIAPGHSAGTTLFTDISILQESSKGKIELELGPATTGGYDRIVVNGGDVEITDGIIDFTDLLAGYNGGTFDLIVADIVTIDSLVLDNARADLTALFAANSVTDSWTLNVYPDLLPNDQDTLRLTVAVPEPASLGLVGLAAIGLAARRRRR